jgi:GT2 family glycosyltransferase
MGVFVQFEAGPDPKELSRPPYGANMAFLRTAFEKYGGFRTDLGRSGNNLLSSEDTEYGDRLLAAGERLRYEPHAIVFHPAPEDHMKKRFVLRWWFWFGYGEVVKVGPPCDTRWVLNGIPLNRIRRIARWALQSIMTLNPKQRFAHMRTAWCLAGEVLACYHRSRYRNLREDEAIEVLHLTSKSAHLETKLPR